MCVHGGEGERGGGEGGGGGRGRGGGDTAISSDTFLLFLVLVETIFCVTL